MKIESVENITYDRLKTCLLLSIGGGAISATTAVLTNYLLTSLCGPCKLGVKIIPVENSVVENPKLIETLNDESYNLFAEMKIEFVSAKFD